jgi:CheY-like chemotaxis protein
LTVRTDCVVLGSSDVRQQLEVKPGEYALLSVTDTGQGMSDEVKAHLFEPFFTTKARGEGTGLGLATVYGIIKQHQGHVDVLSAPGRGTTFNIYLPLTKEARQESYDDERSPHQSSGTETVLLAEDEAILRAFMVRLLRRLGYQVLAAANGEEALRVAGLHRRDIHLLITDVVMPKLGGVELANQLLGSHPELKVLFISGHADDHSLQSAPRVRAAFLQKPFTSAVLVQKIRALLDAPPES